jgi:hypothetical protein
MLGAVLNLSSIVRRFACRHSWFAGLLLVVFLSVQLATAAYACTLGASDPAGQAAQEEMVSCADMAEHDATKNDGQNALCMNHCQADTKHADHPTPQIPAYVPVLISVIVEPPLLDAAPMVTERALAQPRAPPPPHAILHCCFRT